MSLDLPNSFDPSSVFAQLEAAAEKMTATKEKADILTELKKSVLARMTLEYMSDGCSSRVEAETRALACKEYQEYVRGMVEGERQANRALAAYKNMVILAGLRQTEESSRRAMRV